MKKKLVIANVILMLSVLLAVSYQSIHNLLHHNHEEATSYLTNKEKIKFAKNFTKKVNCTVCEFKFATFLSPETFTFSFFLPLFEIPYQFSKKENFNSFCESLFVIRGPPYIV